MPEYKQTIWQEYLEENMIIDFDFMSDHSASAKVPCNSVLPVTWSGYSHKFFFFFFGSEIP